MSQLMLNPWLILYFQTKSAYNNSITSFITKSIIYYAVKILKTNKKEAEINIQVFICQITQYLLLNNDVPKILKVIIKSIVSGNK